MAEKHLFSKKRCRRHGSPGKCKSKHSEIPPHTDWKGWNRGDEHAKVSGAELESHSLPCEMGPSVGSFLRNSACLGRPIQAWVLPERKEGTGPHVDSHRKAHGSKRLETNQIPTRRLMDRRAAGCPNSQTNGSHHGWTDSDNMQESQGSSRERRGPTRDWYHTTPRNRRERQTGRQWWRGGDLGSQRGNGKRARGDLGGDGHLADVTTVSQAYTCPDVPHRAL